MPSLPIPRLRRYGPTSRFYDVVSLEAAVYRAGRAAGIRDLQLRPGDRVLDVACGTGLDFPLLAREVGRRGRIVGVDRSATMLKQARAKAAAGHLEQVEIRSADAADVTRVTAGDPPYDAALFTYALSIIEEWRSVLTDTMRRVRPGGRVVIVDLALTTGRWRWLAPLARLACFAGGADPHRHPWEMLLATTSHPTHQILRGGHVHVVGGTVPAADDNADADDAATAPPHPALPHHPTPSRPAPEGHPDDSSQC